jgi:hypothetical protein
MLGISLTATLCANVFLNAVAFLIPALMAVVLPELAAPC